MSNICAIKAAFTLGTAFSSGCSGGRLLPVTVLVLSVMALHAPSHADDIQALAKTDGNLAEARKLAESLQATPETELTDVLSAMKGATDVSKNWLLSVAQTVADRDASASMRTLEGFLRETSNDPDARFWAFRYLTQGRPDIRQQLLETMMEDPSLPLRYEAVKLRLQRLDEAETMAPEARTAAYEAAFRQARLPSQVQPIAEKLDELGKEVDLQSHFGFLNEWKAVGPFDNRDGVGFEAAYAPEKDYLAGALGSGAYAAKDEQEVEWKVISTTAKDGLLDLSEAYEKEKGAVVYAWAEFESPSQLPCEVRVGSANGTKVWVNQELVIAKDIYHAGNQIDQYVAPVTLKPGKNSILVKSCQNEQTEPWAQDWAFQLRFTDNTGFAIQQGGSRTSTGQ